MVCDPEEDELRRALQEKIIREERDSIAQSISEKWQAEQAARKAIAAQKRRETKARKRQPRKLRRTARQPNFPSILSSRKGLRIGVEEVEALLFLRQVRSLGNME